MREIYIISPDHVATGGTELLQQLCSVLNKNHISCSMKYLGPYENSLVQKKFGNYNNPIAENIIDKKENIVVIPETYVNLAKNIHNATVYYWWLSVDYYYGSGKREEPIIKQFYHNARNRLNRKRFISGFHLAQSKYAYDYLVNIQGIDKSHIAYLSDCLSDTFYNNMHRIDEKMRENIIVYNPRKGYEFTKLLMDRITEYKWIPLIGLSNEEMIEIMLNAKVYVDFGNHPGKDRIPREAAICGCCVITGNLGAASNDEDIPIDRMFKFRNESSDIEDIHSMISLCMNNYEQYECKFASYRAKIINEKSSFERDATAIFSEKQ